MSEEFDASLIYSAPVSADVVAKQSETVENLMLRPNALANAKLHAENELKRLVNSCNRLAWRYVPADLRAPSEEETAALLGKLEQEDRHKLIHDSQQAAEQRVLVVQMQDAYERCMAQMQAEQAEYAQREVEAQLRAEFEAIDEAEKENRFQTWRAARQAS